MKKNILFIASGLFCVCLNAQSSAPDVIASGGGFTIGSGFSNSYTIGQGSLPETFTAGTFILTQGFQQPADIGTGLAPTNESPSIGTYPNPTNGQFSLDYFLETNAQVTVEVYDVLGQMVYSEITSRASGQQNHSINLSTEANGIYFVRCTIKTATQTSVNTSKITLTR